jgi:uncharacterized alpha-E superfamily protein
MLLSRVAESLYWSARYLERSDDTARIVRAYTELIVDLPTSVTSTWEPLLAVTGSRGGFDMVFPVADEASVVRFLIADERNPASLAASVADSRENLRSCREVIPREAWSVVNDLHLYVQSHADDGVARRGRGRFLDRVIRDAHRLDGILSSTMNRDEAYEFLRLGQVIERADMTTRVLGVEAATLMRSGADRFAEVQWMGVLRSLSALQMYHRATRVPVEGTTVVRFLLADEAFPRSVASCLVRARLALERLPHGDSVLDALKAVTDVLATVDLDAHDGALLDAAMEQIQCAIAALHDQVVTTYVR